MYKQREGENAKEGERDRERERERRRNGQRERYTDKWYEQYLCDRNEQKYLLRLSLAPTIYFDLFGIPMTKGRQKFVSRN